MTGPSPARPAESQLRGRYLVQNARLWSALNLTDTLLGALPLRGRASRGDDPPPRRVLLANGGHLGDVVIASAVLPLVKEAWPEAEIGFLLGSWSRAVLDGHPLVSRVHVVDHWKLNRAGSSLVERMRRYGRTRQAALREIRATGYDVAIDLYGYFPNAIPLLWQAGIPHRIGHDSGGFGPLLTRAVPWGGDERHMAEHHLDLLEGAGVRWTERPAPRYTVPVGLPGARGPVELGLPDRYVVVHMGAGSAIKEWPLEKWKEVARRLAAEGHAVVFTGAGAEQKLAADLAAEGCDARNLCDALSWNEFVGVIDGARVVVSVDSVAGHLAAAVGTPSVVLATGVANLHQWRPLHERSRTIQHSTPCAPCFRSAGCASMACVREISADEVVAAVSSELLGAEVARASGTLSPSS